MLRKISSIGIALSLCSGALHAGMIEQVLYNVVGQVSNAVGARLGDEIYYGSSSAPSQRVVHHHRRKHHKKRHKKKHKKVAAKKAIAPIITNEKKIQIALTGLGFYKGKIDGEINSYETRSAIKSMNAAYGLGNNAFLSPQVKDSLIYLGDLFKFDRTLISKGSDKKTKGIKIQSALKVLGFYNGKVDGLIGSGTKRSIAEYKSANGMAANGSLDFEEEYRLITKAQEINSKNIDETIASIKAFARAGQPQQVAMQPAATQQRLPYQPAANNVNSVAVVQSGQTAQQGVAIQQNNVKKTLQVQQSGTVQQRVSNVQTVNNTKINRNMQPEIQQQAQVVHKDIAQKTKQLPVNNALSKQNIQTKEVAVDLNNTTEQTKQTILNQMVQKESSTNANKEQKETQPVQHNSEQPQQPIDEEVSAKVAKK